MQVHLSFALPLGALIEQGVVRVGSRLQVAMERVFEPFSVPAATASSAMLAAAARSAVCREDMYLVTRVRLVRHARDIAALDEPSRERRLAELAWWSEDAADHKGGAGAGAAAAAPAAAEGEEPRRVLMMKPHLAAREHFQSVFSEDDVVRSSAEAAAAHGAVTGASSLPACANFSPRHFLLPPPPPPPRPSALAAELAQLLCG